MSGGALRRIILLGASTASANLGGEIIMEAVENQLASVLV